MIAYVKTFAVLAWAAVAVSSPTAAHATMLTGQAPGTYVTCGNTNGVNVYTGCGATWYYWQSIRFISSTCSSGSCSSDGSQTIVDSVYPIGRKSVTGSNSCPSPDPRHTYTLGSCAC